MNWRRLGKDLLDTLVIGPFMLVMIPFWLTAIILLNAYERYKK